MSKNIKITDESLNEVRKAFEEALSTGKFSDGKITFTKTLGIVNRKATVFFTELAWLKMQTLIREFDKEVAWHGIAKRGEDASKDEYYITDILVYPQEVTGATVSTDQEKYQMWLMNHDDEVFNNIRMQGHSHVNMGVTPSSVDTSLYDRILEQLDDDMFYIFMIWNKRKEKTIKIYDLAKNILFDTSDVTVEVLDDGTGIEKFLKDAKDAVKDKPTTPTTTYQSPYYVCSRKYVAMDCDGIGAVSAEKVEDIVFFEMREKLKEFGELQLHEKPESTLQLTKLKVRADQIEKEIDTLVEKIPTASKATMGYINKKIDELDEEHSRLKKEIADMSADIYGKKDVGVIKNYLNNWESISISDKITVVDALIESVRVNQDTVDIVWKI